MNSQELQEFLEEELIIPIQGQPQDFVAAAMASALHLQAIKVRAQVHGMQQCNEIEVISNEDPIPSAPLQPLTATVAQTPTRGAW
ncbi:UNVERIFIED_CONTAM: hypothetical protein K2H54_067975 [Gekko kuhli]